MTASMTELAPASLDNLATLINESYQQVLEAQDALLPGVSNYLNAKRQTGEYLQQAKSRLKHGQWLAWLKENCPDIAESTARTYMIVARGWDNVEEKLRNVKKSSDPDDLGIEGFLRLLRGNDEIIEAELIEEEDEEDVEVSADSTPLTTQQEVHTPKEETPSYRPLIGDTIKINDPEHKLNGQQIKVDDVIDGGAIILFKTEDGEPAHIFNEKEGIVELVTRPVSSGKTTNSSSSGYRNEPKSGVSADRSFCPPNLRVNIGKTESDLLDSALETIDEWRDWASRTMQCWRETKRLTDELMDEGEKLLELET